jgi:hypothetical protein
MPDYNGNLPLHCAWTNEIPSPEIVNMLIDLFPECISKKDNFGKLPKDLSAAASSDLQ